LLVIALAGLIGTCSSPPPLLDQILETGELRVVTRHSPTAYVIGPDGSPSGPEFDLAYAFANELDVELVVETVQSVSEVLPFMLSGKAHLAAAGLSITPTRRSFVNFGHPYEMVDMHLIYKLGTGKPRSVDDVLGRTIEVVSGTSHVDMLASLKEIYPDLNWVENADVRSTSRSLTALSLIFSATFTLTFELRSISRSAIRWPGPFRVTPATHYWLARTNF
jgi:membrane-bound lytic murein transglycosylase F